MDQELLLTDTPAADSLTQPHFFSSISLDSISHNNSRIVWQRITVKANSGMKPLLTLALPNVVIYVLQNLVDIVGLFFVGHLENSAAALEAVGLGTAWVNLTTYYIMLGLTLAVDTLVSQSYGKDKKWMCGIYYYRIAVVVTIACIPFVGIILLGYRAMLAFGIKEELAYSSSVFAIYLIPSLFTSIHFEMIKKFLNAQQIVNPTTVLVICTTVLHALFCYLFIFFFGFGYLGAALAKFGTSFCNIVLIAGYILYSGCCAETLPSLSWDIFHEWTLVLQMAVPGALLMCFDFWVYEILNLLLAKASPRDLAANVGLSQISFVLYMIPSGFGNATTTFVGNHIGAKDVPKAKFYMRVCVTASVSVMLVGAVLAILGRNVLGMLVTTDSQVLTIFSLGVVIVCLAEIPDAIQVVLSRTMMALGLQKLAAVCMFITSYAILLPLGYVFLSMFNWGVFGYWLAVFIGNISLILQYSFWLLRTDWDAIALEVAERRET